LGGGGGGGGGGAKKADHLQLALHLKKIKFKKVNISNINQAYWISFNKSVLLS
jgi:hypothetical protein